MVNVSQTIDDYLTNQTDWQKTNLTIFRSLVHEVEPDVEEAWKWSVPVFLVNGKLVCAMSTFKEHTKYNFFEGAALRDPHGLFNSGLDSKRNRSINLQVGQKLDTDQLSDLLREAMHHA